MSFVSNLTCAECRSDYNYERLQNIYTEYEDPLFAQYDPKKTDTILAASEQLVADSWVHPY